MKSRVGVLSQGVRGDPHKHADRQMDFGASNKGLGKIHTNMQTGRWILVPQTRGYHTNMQTGRWILVPQTRG